MRTLVGPSEFLCPLLVPDGGSAESLALGRIFALAFTVLTVKLVVHLDDLLGASDHIVGKAYAVHASENLVLARHVKLRKDLV